MALDRSQKARTRQMPSRAKLGMTFPFLPAIDSLPQRFHLLPCSVPQVSGHFDAALGHVFHPFLGVARPVFGFFRPVLQRVFSVVVAAFQVAAELFTAFRGKRKRYQGSRAESNQKKRNGSSQAVSFRRFITSQAHNVTSFPLGGSAGHPSARLQYPANRNSSPLQGWAASPTQARRRGPLMMSATSGRFPFL